MREGDRSEYFANVLLSGLGLSVPTPRQEDIGIDYSCNIADQEKGVLTFGSPYLVSVKSVSEPTIEMTPTEAAIKSGSQRHVEWLFRQELPVFLGVVDKDEFSMRMYSLIPRWFIYYEGGPRCGALTLVPRLNSDDKRDVGRPEDKGEIEGWPKMHHFEVDLGQPIVTVTLEALKAPEATANIKALLRRAVSFDAVNRAHYHLHVPYFHWFPQITTNVEFRPAFYALPVPHDEEGRRRFVKQLAPALTSLALYHKGSGDEAKLKAIKLLLEEVPAEFLPPDLIKGLPEIFPSPKAGVV